MWEAFIATFVPELPFSCASLSMHFQTGWTRKCHITVSTNNWFPSLDEISHVSSSHLNMCSIFHMLHNYMISLQCVLSCTFKSFKCDQVLSHCMQQSGYSSVWIFFWLFMWPDYEKDMTQVLYLNDFSPVWVIFCVPNSIAFTKHFWHIICFSIVWAISCLLNIPDVKKFLSQLMPLNAFSPVWIISCIFKAFVFDKVLTLCAPKGFFCSVGHLIYLKWVDLE